MKKNKPVTPLALKKLISFALAIFPFFGFCQTGKVQSKLESMSDRSGVLYKNEYTDIGYLPTFQNLSKMYVRVLRITDLKTNLTVSGIKVQVDNSFAFLDQDEIDGLILALDKMKEMATLPAPANHTEYVFISRVGFQVMIWSNEKKEWNFNVELNKYSLGGLIPFGHDVERLNKFSELVSTAKTSL